MSTRSRGRSWRDSPAKISSSGRLRYSTMRPTPYSARYRGSLSQGFRRRRGKGGRLRTFTSLPGMRTSVPQLGRIRDARPAALFLPNFSRDVLAQTRQARSLGIDAVFLGSDSWPTDMASRHPVLSGSFLSLSWHLGFSSIYQETRDFVVRYREAEGGEPNELGALTYDAFGLLFDAVRASLAGRSRGDPSSARTNRRLLGRHRTDHLSKSRRQPAPQRGNRPVYGP